MRGSTSHFFYNQFMAFFYFFSPSLFFCLSSVLLMVTFLLQRHRRVLVLSFWFHATPSCSTLALLLPQVWRSCAPFLSELSSTLLQFLPVLDLIGLMQLPDCQVEQPCTNQLRRTSSFIEHLLLKLRPITRHKKASIFEAHLFSVFGWRRRCFCKHL